MKKNSIVNWENVSKESSTFKNNKPFKFAFVKEFLERKFYEKLYETYPKFDQSWRLVQDIDKLTYRKVWNNRKPNKIDIDEFDNNFSESWNIFHNYLHSDGFIQKIREFSGVKIEKMKTFGFALLRKGGYQLPHIHNVGPSTLIMMIYFSKNWKEGQAGGTYVAPVEDESKIIFEPYDLDNSMVVFHDGPSSAHGVRPITEDVERRAVQVYLEGYDPLKGWSANQIKREKIDLKKTGDAVIH